MIGLTKESAKVSCEEALVTMDAFQRWGQWHQDMKRQIIQVAAIVDGIKNTSGYYDFHALQYAAEDSCLQN